MSRYTTHGIASGSGSGGLPRESVYPGAVPPSDHLSHLEDCITATEGCVSTLAGCLTRLSPGIEDLPRLKRVLANKHVRRGFTFARALALNPIVSYIPLLPRL